jgi:hypothetical protein
VGLVERRVEAGPAGAALELGLVFEQRQAALAAAIDAGALLAQQAAAERGLGAVVQQDPGLLGRQVGLQALAFGLGRRGQVEAAGGGEWAVSVIRQYGRSAAVAVEGALLTKAGKPVA